MVKNLIMDQFGIELNEVSVGRLLRVIGTTWAPKGKTPVIRTAGARHSLNLISAISAKGQTLFMTIK